MNCLTIAAILATTLATDYPVFQHSRQAKTLTSQYQGAVNQAQESYERALAQAQASYLEKAADLERTYRGELEKVLATETKSGRLDAAVEVRDAVKNLKPVGLSDGDKTNPVPTPTQPMESGKVFPMLAGNYQFNWDGEKELRWTLTPQGVLRRREKVGQLTIQDGRIFWADATINNDVMQIIPYSNALVVIQWTSKQGLNPFRDLPSNVGIARRLP